MLNICCSRLTLHHCITVGDMWKGKKLIFLGGKRRLKGTEGVIACYQQLSVETLPHLLNLEATDSLAIGRAWSVRPHTKLEGHHLKLYMGAISHMYYIHMSTGTCMQTQHFNDNIIWDFRINRLFTLALWQSDTWIHIMKWLKSRYINTKSRYTLPVLLLTTIIKKTTTNFRMTSPKVALLVFEMPEPYLNSRPIIQLWLRQVLKQAACT